MEELDQSQSVYNPLGGIFTDELVASIERVGEAIQDARIKIAMAKAQVSDVSNQRLTLNNLVAQFNAMSPNGQIAVGIFAGIVVWALLRG